MDSFFQTLQTIADKHKLLIDRPKGSAHPRYPDYIYPLDYGYLEATSSQDGAGIDVWLGSGNTSYVTGILVVVDGKKKDSEIKILLGCSEEEAKIALEASRRGKMSAILIKREEV